MSFRRIVPAVIFLKRFSFFYFPPMPVSPSKARSLCTSAEYNLVKASTAKAIKDLSPAQLKQKVDRARKLRDKNRDLAKQQRGEARGKRKPTSTRPSKGNENTVLKSQLFDEVLSRFQKAIEKNEAAPAKATKKKTTAKKAGKKSAKKKTVRTPGGSTPKKSTSKAASKGKTPKKAAASQTGTKPIPLAAPTSGTFRGTASLSGSGRSASFSDLLSSSQASQDSRETRRRDKSKSSQVGREQSHFARTSQEKIQGHVSASTRRSQAKRDSKGS